MKKIVFRLFVLSTMTLSLASCKKDKEDSNANQIEDASGLKVSMNWTVSSGTALDSDLDIFIYQGTTITTPVGGSDNSDQFETFNLASTMPDGDYTITVEPYDVAANGNYTISISGVTNTKTWEVKNVAFTTSDNTERAVIRVNKTGNKFTLTKL